MNLATVLKLIPLLTPAVEAVRGWFAPRKAEPTDAKAAREGAAAGAAAHQASKTVKRPP